MTRRNFTLAASGFAMMPPISAANAGNAFLELRRYDLRNTLDHEAQRTAEFLAHGAAPALERAGAGPIGIFSTAIGPGSPSCYLLISYPSFAAIETVREKLRHDGDYAKALESFDSAPGLAYQRMDSWLLRCFDGKPTVEPPPTEGRKAHRIFELRMYESNNRTTLARKIGMFNGGEIGIFERLGMQPVFFGETLAGPKMPNLIYMLSFDDLAAREKLWGEFGSDPEWHKLSHTPGLSDPEIVSNINNLILSPLAGSQIR